jgi:hypothetical protein
MEPSAEVERLPVKVKLLRAAVVQSLAVLAADAVLAARVAVADGPVLHQSVNGRMLPLLRLLLLKLLLWEMKYRSQLVKVFSIL